jgi:HD-GYP domain-containing protein (c-di-GMP phosphodiesterase class II)
LKITLLVESNSRLEHLYRLNLSTWVGLEIMAKRSAESAVLYLTENFEKVELIIVRAVKDKETSARLILDFLKLHELSIPLIVLGPGDVNPKHHLKNSLDLKSLIKTAANLLSITAKDMSERPVADFYPIALLYFNVIHRSVVNVYLKQQDESEKYLLRFEKNKDFESNVISELTRQGVTHLYVDKLDRLEFVSNVSAELISQLEITDLSDDERISANSSNMELLTRKLISLGIREETIKLANKSIISVRNNVKIHPNLERLLQRMIANETSYLYRHTQILTYVALHIIRNIDWGSDDQAEKLSFICFFHDIALETDLQCQIRTTAQMNAAPLSAQERSLVERHAQIAAEYVTKFPRAPMGADQIIRQHHGQLNGVGFSENYGANISPMAQVFIVAEEFTKIIIERGNGPFEHAEMMKELKDIFPTARFAKIIEKLNTLKF